MFDLTGLFGLDANERAQLAFEYKTLAEFVVPQCGVPHPGDFESIQLAALKCFFQGQFKDGLGPRHFLVK